MNVAVEELIRFLLDPKSYPHRPRSVRLVQTHASYVFLAPPYVYKVKKPVNYGFLNFSTLERRRFYCRRELELNRRLCPDIYLGIMPISRLNGNLVFGEGGEVVEYAVKMRKLAEGKFLDQRVARGDVLSADIDRIVETLRKFYACQNPTKEVESWGRIGRLRISTEENFRQVQDFIGENEPAHSAEEKETERQGRRNVATISRPGFEAIRFYTREYFARNARLFTARIEEKRVRDCHGDLHAEHIHITPQALHIYDCIEFNDRFRYVDVANDAAFLAMDLDYDGRPDLAREFVSKMSRALKDPGMLRLMDFYKCYRAVVRGKVESLQGMLEVTAEIEREASLDRGRRYFRLALQYATAGSCPLVMVVMGPIAAGKSTLARGLGNELGWKVISSDRVRKELAGYPLFERSEGSARERLYTEEMTGKTYGELLAKAERNCLGGQSVILDARFARPEHRERLVATCKKVKCDWVFVEVHTSDRAMKERLRGRESVVREVSDARLEDFEVLKKIYVAPAEIDAAHRIRVCTTGPADRSLRMVLRSLATRRI